MWRWLNRGPAGARGRQGRAAAVVAGCCATWWYTVGLDLVLSVRVCVEQGGRDPLAF